MSEKAPKRVWLILLTCAAVLTGCGIFFAMQDLGTANEYASIASFFLALLTAAGSVLSMARAKPGKDISESAAKRRGNSSWQTTINGNVGALQQGDGSVMEITLDATPTPKSDHRKAGRTSKKK
jgi:hypothetical protein